MASTATSPTGVQKRVSRACTFCRGRKSKCDLDISGGSPPCQRCIKEKREDECVLGSSNRGGSRIRKKHLSIGSNISPVTPTNHSPVGPKQEDLPHFDPRITSQAAPMDTSPLKQNNLGMEPNRDDEDDATIDSAIETAIPANPSDAWQSLENVPPRNVNSDAMETGLRGIASYRLVREGRLSPDAIAMLVANFRDHYHAYLPLVPRKYYEASALDHFAIDNKHLLTAVLTIASKDKVDDNGYTHECCSRYMHDLISSIAAGTDCDVEAVEALLLLAEWVPHGLRKSGEAVGRGEEDRTAWMHVGMALRTGYFLGLDRTSFRSEDAEEAKSISRKRLAWTCCYISDRLISCRIGKAFWSRGPGPMTGLSERDFPSLQRTANDDVDHAKIFQAILDLTQIYSNVHDILYTATRASGQMILMGDYVKYIDEFRSAMARWDRQWGPLDCPAHIKVTLHLSYQYLQLYTNAFAFQATISQTLSKKAKGDPQNIRDRLRNAFQYVGTMPDARFILKSVEAAKEYLNCFVTEVNSDQLRYMPIRFYLYCIYSAVFLYKARSFGVFRAGEESEIWRMITAAVTKLKEASVSHQDSGARYARLLELLWQKSRPPASREDTAASFQGTQDPVYPRPLSAQMSDTSSTGYNMSFSPANGFSWLDLQGTADYASGGQYGETNMLIPMDGLPMDNMTYPTPMISGMDGTPQQYPWTLDVNSSSYLF